MILNNYFELVILPFFVHFMAIMSAKKLIEVHGVEFPQFYNEAITIKNIVSFQLTAWCNQIIPLLVRKLKTRVKKLGDFFVINPTAKRIRYFLLNFHEQLMTIISDHFGVLRFVPVNFSEFRKEVIYAILKFFRYLSRRFSNKKYIREILGECRDLIHNEFYKWMNFADQHDRSIFRESGTPSDKIVHLISRFSIDDDIHGALNGSNLVVNEFTEVTL